MSDKEIIGAFNHIDVNKTGTLQRTYYMQEVRKAMRASKSDLGISNLGNTRPNTG